MTEVAIKMREEQIKQADKELEEIRKLEGSEKESDRWGKTVLEATAIVNPYIQIN